MITRKEIAAYEQLEERRASLLRQASDLQKQAEVYTDRFEEEVRKRGGKTRTIEACGYIMAIKMVKNAVQWKPEFIRVASIAEAEEIIAAAGTKEKFVMEPIESAPAPAASARPGRRGSRPK